MGVNPSHGSKSTIFVKRQKTTGTSEKSPFEDACWLEKDNLLCGGRADSNALRRLQRTKKHRILEYGGGGVRTKTGKLLAAG